MSLLVEVYPLDGPDAFTTSGSTYALQVAVQRVGDNVDLRAIVYRVVGVTWIYGARLDPPRVVVRVRLAFPPRVRKWWRPWR